MNELDETLNRRRMRSEVAGAVFEVGSRGQEADMTWDEHTSGQFTPKGSHGRPSGFDDPPPPVKGKGKGRRNSANSVEGADVARMDSPEGLRNKSSPERERPARRLDSLRREIIGLGPADEFTQFMPGVGSPALRPPVQAVSAGVEEPRLLFEAEVQPRLEQRDSEMSRATVDAGALSAAPPTAPASPVSSARGLPTTSEARSLALPPSPGKGSGGARSGDGSPTDTTNSEGGWGPTPGGTGLRPPAGPASMEEQPSMSSSSYFRPYVRQQIQEPLVARPALTPQVPASLDAFAQPFPKAKEAVLQKKLREASEQVRALCDCVSAALAKPKMHPAEVQEILRMAERVQAETRLGDADLECIGWPTKVLHQMKDIMGHVENWQRWEKEAKKAIEEGRGPLHVVVKALEGILVAWSRLTQVRHGPLRVDPGLERRATSTVPLVSALLDQTMALVRRNPEVFVMRQLEALLRHSVAQHPLTDLGVAPLFKQALHELDESVQGLPYGNASASGMYLAAPEVVWRSVVDGDAATIANIIHQGGLVSGRTCDPKGHSILWDAIAFSNPEVALLLMRSFPPDMPYGVDLGELHPRNGNSLLHLASGLQVFSPQAEGLFAVLFERMPEALRLHRNARGQTFLHIAAGRLHTLVLKFAAVRGLEALFDVADMSGWTPRSILEHRLAELKVASQAATPQDCGSARLPSWFPLAALQPPMPGSQPPFADAVVEVEDAARGRQQLHAHSVILAGCSRILHMQLKAAEVRKQFEHDCAVSDGNKAPKRTPLKVRLDPDICSSLDVALFVLRFLYTGETECGFSADAGLMLQLVRLAGACALPAPLRAWALGTLLQHLDESTSGAEVVELMRDAEQLRMTAEQQCFVARRLFSSDAAWRAVEDERRGQVIEAALDAMEPFIAAASGSSMGPAAPAQAPLGSAVALPSGPAGSGVLPREPSGPLGMPLGSGALDNSMLGVGAGAFGGSALGPGLLPRIEETPFPVPQAVPSGGWW